MMVKCYKSLDIRENSYSSPHLLFCNRKEGHKGDHWAWWVNHEKVQIQFIWKNKEVEE